MIIFINAILLLCLFTSSAVVATNDGAFSGNIIVFVDNDASIKACPCTIDNVCDIFVPTTTSPEEEQVVDEPIRLCMWSFKSNEQILESINDLSFVKENIDVEGGDVKITVDPLVPSPDIDVNCEIASEDNLCILENVPLLIPSAFLQVKNNDILEVSLVGSADIRIFLAPATDPPNEVPNSLRGGNNDTTTVVEDGENGSSDLIRIAFHLKKTTTNTTTQHEDGIPVTAIALVSGVAVLLQSSYFLVRYMYGRSKADLPA